MSWRYQGGHALLRTVVAPQAAAFRRASGQLEKTQRRLLHSLLADVSRSSAGVDRHWRWEDFARALPVTDYGYWRGAIDQQRCGASALIDSPVMRYQPTSGSTSAIKWIPYSARFLAELDRAIAPWLSDLYRGFPAIRRGTHYWSLSWVPTEMREQLHGHINDDMKLLSGGKRLLASMTQGVPESVSLASSSADSLFATLAWLVADQDLAVISVWSPTFALTLLERLSDWRDELVEVLANGDWGPREPHMAGIRPPRAAHRAALLRAWDGRLDENFLRSLWPRLALISAWDTAFARPWARRLASLFPHVGFQGKGLWTTEGVVTIPFRGRHLLACRSHVYEFEDLETGQILPPWQLRVGQQVSPLISTGSGLLRYRIEDVLSVTGHLHETPAFEFLGRRNTCDLVGEKLSTLQAQQVLDAVDFPAGSRPVTLLALENANAGASQPDSRPGYVLLLEGRLEQQALRALASQVERRLCEHFHYQVARNIGQLVAVQVMAAPDMHRLYIRECQRRGMIEGNIKIEPLRFWQGNLPDVLRTTLPQQTVELGQPCTI